MDEKELSTHICATCGRPINYDDNDEGIFVQDYGRYFCNEYHLQDYDDGEEFRTLTVNSVRNGDEWEVTTGKYGEYSAAASVAIEDSKG